MFLAWKRFNLPSYGKFGVSMIHLARKKLAQR